MATVAKSMTTNRHPWHQWADGRIWVLTKGVDFTCSIFSLRAAAWRYARDNAKRSATRVRQDGTVEMQFTKAAP